MRTKSSAHHIPTVIDLTYSQEQQQEPAPISPTNQQLKPSVGMKKTAKSVREKKNNSTAKVRKVPCSTTTGKKPPIKRRRIHQQDTPVPLQQHPAGLYQFDLSDMIRQKLKMLFEPTMMAAHGTSFIPYDPRYGWGTGARQPTAMRLDDPAATVTRATAPSYQACSVPGCSQEAVSAGLSRHHSDGRLTQTGTEPGRRFSIFRSVELMAQSSCAPNH